MFLVNGSVLAAMHLFNSYSWKMYLLVSIDTKIDKSLSFVTLAY